MPLIYSGGKKVFFAHIPKTGGTSIQDYLFNRFGSLTLLGRHRQYKNGSSLIVSATHLSAYDLEEILPTDLDWSFAIVRDPVQRLISEYRFQRGASRTSRIGFSIWLRIMIAAARRDPRIYDNHIRPQVDFLLEGTEIFRIENGLDKIIPHIDDIMTQSAPSLKIRHMLKGKTEPVHIHREDLRVIFDFYAADFERFGYPEPDYNSFPQDYLAWLKDFVAPIIGYLVVFRHRQNWVKP